MPLESPNLDDRSFHDLLQEAKGRIAALCPAWTDHSAGDPGIVLLELFAHLTEIMIYRLNRLPEKAYIEFLKLMGVKLLPPAAARVSLRFQLAEGQEREVEIPRGLRVTIGRTGGSGEAPVFVTAHAARIGPGQPEADVLAHHCDLVEGELAGIGTGLPGQSVKAQRPPIVAPSGDELDLVVGVAMDAATPDARVPSREHGGKAYRIWREVEDFTAVEGDHHVYIVDRMAGVITFAPAVHLQGAGGGLDSAVTALAAAPGPGKEIRLWYRRGGGPQGNVGAGLLTVLKDPLPGVLVSNPRPAAGGRAAETLENALVRGPRDLHSLKRAVTARDFELVALRSGAIARARAFTRAALWRHAAPGGVTVLIVPSLPEDVACGPGSGRLVREHATEEVRLQVQKALDERRPLGTMCEVAFARCKEVAVAARVVVHREEEPMAVRARVLERLDRMLSPVGSWPFGQSLRASNVFDVVLSEPGVRYVDDVALLVEAAPHEHVMAIEADQSQPRTWYAGTGGQLFRSMNDGEGFELAARFEGESVALARSHPELPGLLAVTGTLPDGGARIHLSRDCGESFEARVHELAFPVHGAAWILRQGVPVLLLATGRGLYELDVEAGDAGPVQVLVEPKDQDRGFYAVAAMRSVRGALHVAAASQQTGGVYLSADGGLPGTFHHVGLEDEDVRILATQRDGPRSFLWAGVAAAGGIAGKGCFRWELRDDVTSPEGWRPISQGWDGGSMTGLAFTARAAYAGSHQAGVLRLDLTRPEPAWQAPRLNCGLPLRNTERLLYRIEGIAARASAEAPEEPDRVMAGGALGTFMSRDGGSSFESCSERRFRDRVSLPETWLFCPGTHQIEVLGEDETR